MRFGSRFPRTAPNVDALFGRVNLGRGMSDLQQKRCGPLVFGDPAEDNEEEAVVKLRTPVWCLPKALRCLSQLYVVILTE